MKLYAEVSFAILIAFLTYFVLECVSILIGEFLNWIEKRD